MSSVADRLHDVPLRNAKADTTPRRNPTAADEPRRNPTPRGALVDQARKNANLEVKQMAADMGVSESFLLRGFKDQEHISWQRLKQVQSAAFHREFLAVQARDLDGVEVITTISVRRTA